VIARDVDGLTFQGFTAQKGAGPLLDVDLIKNLTIKGSAPLPDTTAAMVGKMTY
jgi:hypothetical protein